MNLEKKAINYSLKLEKKKAMKMRSKSLVIIEEGTDGPHDSIDMSAAPLNL
jgi:hypothetical protein